MLKRILLLALLLPTVELGSCTLQASAIPGSCPAAEKCKKPKPRPKLACCDEPVCPDGCVPRPPRRPR